MNENSGVIRLDTLVQSDYWVDRDGVQHVLTGMTQGYLGNVLSHLRRMASNLYALELRRQEDLLFIAEASGWDNGRDASVLPRGQAAAGEWLENTPLVKTLRTMLEDTGQ